MYAPQITRTPQDWDRDAACRKADVDTGLFFSEDLGDITRAKHVCATCPVMAHCLEQAVVNAEPWGVWGGQLFVNGKVLAVKRRRGRPRKHPRPEDVVPTLPVPEHLRALVRSA